MKKILILLVTILSATTAYADVNTNASAGSDSASVSKANATGGASNANGVNLIKLDQSSHNSGNVAGTDLSTAVGFSAAPALTTTLTETCMGSTSVGAGFSGGSFSFGTTWRDSACVRRLDAREIKTFGDIQAAKEIMCDSDLVKAAFKRVGRPCVEDGGVYTPAVEAVAPAASAPAEQAQAPVATDAKVHDDQDEIAQKNQAIWKAADEAREEMKLKGY